MSTKRQKEIKKARNILRNNLPKNTMCASNKNAEGVVDRYTGWQTEHQKIKAAREEIKTRGVAANPKRIGL